MIPSCRVPGYLKVGKKWGRVERGLDGGKGGVGHILKYHFDPFGSSIHLPNEEKFTYEEKI